MLKATDYNFASTLQTYHKFKIRQDKLFQILVKSLHFRWGTDEVKRGDCCFSYLVQAISCHQPYLELLIFKRFFVHDGYVLLVNSQQLVGTPFNKIKWFQKNNSNHANMFLCFMATSLFFLLYSQLQSASLFMSAIIYIEE